MQDHSIIQIPWNIFLYLSYIIPLLDDLIKSLCIFFYETGLINDDISDDVTCANLIYSRQGFKAWYGWINHCDGQDTESYVSDCNL